MSSVSDRRETVAFLRREVVPELEQRYRLPIGEVCEKVSVGLGRTVSRTRLYPALKKAGLVSRFGMVGFTGKPLAAALVTYFATWPDRSLSEAMSTTFGNYTEVQLQAARLIHAGVLEGRSYKGGQRLRVVAAEQNGHSPMPPQESPEATEPERDDYAAWVQAAEPALRALFALTSEGTVLRAEVTRLKGIIGRLVDGE